MRSVDDQKAVNALRDDIVSELKHEKVSVQIRVAFAVMTQVIIDGTTTDPDAVRSTLLELQGIMKTVQ
jgi:hypothetical protein